MVELQFVFNLLRFSLDTEEVAEVGSYNRAVWLSVSH